MNNWYERGHCLQPTCTTNCQWKLINETFWSTVASTFITFGLNLISCFISIKLRSRRWSEKETAMQASRILSFSPTNPATHNYHQHNYNENLPVKLKMSYWEYGSLGANLTHHVVGLAGWGRKGKCTWRLGLTWSVGSKGVNWYTCSSEIKKFSKPWARR